MPSQRITVGEDAKVSEKVTGNNDECERANKHHANMDDREYNLTTGGASGTVEDEGEEDC